jgi:benzoyl-CoA reductase subunit C
MRPDSQERVGFACAYTPVALIHAAGFVPFRMLPQGDLPDQAGAVLHDNLCPHVKRLLDRALAGNLPPLTGVILMNSCDAMRRLADAWTAAKPTERVLLVDLPVSNDAGGVAYLATELRRLVNELASWSHAPVSDGAILDAMAGYRTLADGLARLAGRAGRGELPGGRRALQELLNHSVTAPLAESLAEVERLERAAGPPRSSRRCPPVPLYLFGNVLPAPEAFDLLESCGALVVEDDLCTGSRQLAAPDLARATDLVLGLAAGLLARPPCARTVDHAGSGRLAERVVAAARAAGARGVVAHVLKFCDPYLTRLPGVRQALADAGLPLLVLEGDCTVGALGAALIAWERAHAA